MSTDYVFFGQAFRWPPSEVDNLPWSQRKEILTVYKDFQENNKSK